MHCAMWQRPQSGDFNSMNIRCCYFRWDKGFLHVNSWGKESAIFHWPAESTSSWKCANKPLKWIFWMKTCWRLKIQRWRARPLWRIKVCISYIILNFIHSRARPAVSSVLRHWQFFKLDFLFLRLLTLRRAHSHSWRVVHFYTSNYFMVYYKTFINTLHKYILLWTLNCTYLHIYTAGSNNICNLMQYLIINQ